MNPTREQELLAIIREIDPAAYETADRVIESLKHLNTAVPDLPRTPDGRVDRGDQYPTPGESIPAEGGGWWSPYVETAWGYFRFAVRPVEQPDGLILFWHDAQGAHSQSVIFDRPSRWARFVARLSR